MRRRASRVDNPLWDPFVVEVGVLLAEVEILEQGWPALANPQ
jgi:hypothetical protein